MRCLTGALSILIVICVFCCGCGDDDSETQRLSYPVVANLDSTANLGTISLMVMAGAHHDPPGGSGTAAETAGRIVLQNGESGRRINEEIQSTGASLAASVSSLSTEFHVTAQPQNLFEAFESFRNALLRPDFSLPRSDWARQPVTNDRSVFLYSVSELVHNVITGRESIASKGAVSQETGITAESLTEFHRRYYCRDNIAVGISGNVPDSLQSLVITAFDPLGAGADRTGAEIAFDIEETTILLIERRPGSISSFAIGIPIRIDKDDFYPALVAAHYIGGSVERSGLLSERLVFDRSIAEYVTGRFYSAHTGPATEGIVELVPGEMCVLLAESATLERNLEFAVKLCLESIAEVARNGIQPEDIDRIKRYLVNRFPLRMDSPLSKTECMLDEILIGDPEFIERFESEILRVTDSAVNVVLEEAFSGVPYVIAAEVGDPDKFRDSLLDDKIEADYDPAVDRDPLRYRDIRISQSAIVTSPDQIVIRR